ncbi:transglycosylase SLT domain-containing protein [Rhodopseudomonas sp. RCAM05734]|uniref:transglycosylase SLT domain-containing protein n=1 Tax=Rhodopseudomonas sp. RCAM05734 TaxID=3457549 RepID=UPI004044ACE3
MTRISAIIGTLLLLAAQPAGCGSGHAEDAAPAPAVEAASPGEPAAIPPEKADAAPEPAKVEDGAKNSSTRETMCLMIESAASAHDLPLEFFARVIWQESRFQADAVGPLTRGGQRAQGIAQFMPGTANERRLLDPFDPVQALPKSAEFLEELRDQFGNLGLAAAAYNAGPRRVQDWLDGKGTMPGETRNYVSAITGATVEDWQAAGRNGKVPERASPSDCRALMALLQRAPNPFVTQLELHVTLGENRPWGVQLAAGFNRDRALMMYARAMKRLSAVIGDRDPNLLGTLLRSRGTRTFYQVRIGTDTRGDADELCGRIRRAGQACLVLRNSTMKG